MATPSLPKITQKKKKISADRIEVHFKLKCVHKFGTLDIIRGCLVLLMPIFANPYPKTHTEESPMKSKAQKPAKKTKEEERSKERSARERDLQQNTNLQIGRAHV